MTEVPAIKGIDHFSIPVSDADRSLSFYETVFGARVYEDSNGPYVFGRSESDRALGRAVHIFVTIGSVRMELLGEDPGGAQPFGTHHAFAVDAPQIIELQEHLRAHAVPFWGPATHKGTNTASIYVKDPDNNQLEFVCWEYPDHAQLPLSQHMERPNPHFEWDADGLRAIPLSAPGSEA